MVKVHAHYKNVGDGNVNLLSKPQMQCNFAITLYGKLDVIISDAREYIESSDGNLNIHNIAVTDGY